ncbi:type II toxin-antitoxin system VapC family toxin [Candidatus Acetothermia bacterium]|jgi:predicted nucleic acid-binding protein|nr:type II toxin-antitoxin system VapC family toxin [Candidatus Acetothermia bacterium]MCI2432566.1 type II toxin-antitoxin system VapC family toxin [Candidatus Acetothermia bacterium]MCI2435857.1 type II toxin-antitoxin system VapC family toxin [Candidatus Acetothermia bacterium]
MPTFYVDTSALAKRYQEEEGSPFMDQLFALFEAQGNKGAASFLTFLELLAMLRRLLKGQRLNQASYNRLLADILRDLDTYFSVSPLNTSILTKSAQVITNHALKAPDAIQLATALELEPVLQQLSQRLVFIAADEDLLTAAAQEGLEAISPSEKTALRRLRQLTKNR